MPNKGPRSYVSEFSVSIGPINLLGKLVGVKATGAGEESKFISVCPDCETPIKPAQLYRCVSDHEHPIGELSKAKELDDGTLAFVSKEALAEARASDLPVNVFRSTVHPAAQVENSTFPSDSAYVFVPRSKDEFYDLAVRIVEDTDKAFVAQSNVRNHEGFYRLTTWRGYLLIQRLYWPSEVNEFEQQESSVERKVFNAAVAMLDRLVEDFTPESYVATTKERLVELVAALDPNAPPAPAAPASKPRKTDVTADLLNALSAFGDAEPKSKRVKKSA